jgi:hypothetical protein
MMALAEVVGSFPSSDSRSKGILDLMHSDLCGPMTVVSFEEEIAFWRSRGSHMEIDSEGRRR